MNRICKRLTITAGMCLAIAATSIFAATPNTINYQGRLTDAAGDPVADGGNLIKFVIYDAALGGASLWSSGFQNVATVNGLFTYDLGSNVALPDGLFTDTGRYLGITVGIDPEISPRSQLETSAYAYHALRADTALFAESMVGVTQIFDIGESIITGFLNVLGTDSINCPADGFVMMNMSMGMNANHLNGNEDVLFVFLLDSALLMTPDQDGRTWALPSTLPNGLYSNPIHLHKVFLVSQGWNEFNVVGFQNPGGGTDTFNSQDVTVSLLYIPQSFGSVADGSPLPASSQFNSLPKKIERTK